MPDRVAFQAVQPRAVTGQVTAISIWIGVGDLLRLFRPARSRED